MDMSSMETNQEKKPSPLLRKILHTYKDPIMQAIVRVHLVRILKYDDDVLKNNGKFFCEEDYENYVVSRFFWDHFLKSSDSEPMETESILPNVDPEVEKFFDSLPPVKAFHMSPVDKMIKKKEFWDNVKPNEVFNAKIASTHAKLYELFVINKYNENKRLIDLSIKALMMINDTSEVLIPGTLVRVVVRGCCDKIEGDPQLVVTVNPALHEQEKAPVDLGVIKETDIPFLPVNACDYNSFHEFVTTHSSCIGFNTHVKMLPSLGIDPGKIYTFDERLLVKRRVEMENAGGDETFYKAVNELRLAHFYKGFNDLDSAMKHVDKAIEISPKYVEAYVFRGERYLDKAAGKPCKFVKLAILDFERALKISNYSNPVAVKYYCRFRIQSAHRFIEACEYSKAKTNLINVIKLCNNEIAKELLEEVEIKSILSKQLQLMIRVAEKKVGHFTLSCLLAN